MAKKKKLAITSLIFLVIINSLAEQELISFLGFNFSNLEMVLLLFVIISFSLIGIDLIKTAVKYLAFYKAFLYILLALAGMLIFNLTISLDKVATIKGLLRFGFSFYFILVFIYSWRKGFVYQRFILYSLIILSFLYTVISVIEFLYPSINYTLIKLFTDIESINRLRPHGTMINPNLFAWYLLASFVFVITIVFNRLTINSSKTPLFITFLFAIAMGPVQSRNIWISLILVLISLMLIYKNKHLRRSMWIAFICFIILLVVLFPQRFNLVDPFTAFVEETIGKSTLVSERNSDQSGDNEKLMNSKAVAQDRHTGNTVQNPRITLWKSAVNMALKHPFTGVGINVYKEVFPDYIPVNANKSFFERKRGVFFAHNIFLTYLAEAGFPGLILFLIVSIYLVYFTISKASVKIIPWWIVIFATGLFDDFSGYYLFLIFSGIYTYIIYYYLARGDIDGEPA